MDTRMPAAVKATVACEARGYEYAGCEPLAAGGMVALARNPAGERLEAWGYDALDACWRLARVAGGRAA